VAEGPSASGVGSSSSEPQGFDLESQISQESSASDGEASPGAGSPDEEALLEEERPGRKPLQLQRTGSGSCFSDIMSDGLGARRSIGSCETVLRSAGSYDAMEANLESPRFAVASPRSLSSCSPQALSARRRDTSRGEPGAEKCDSQRPMSPSAGQTLLARSFREQPGAEKYDAQRPGSPGVGPPATQEACCREGEALPLRRFNGATQCVVAM